jgi:plastocyanin
VNGCLDTDYVDNTGMATVNIAFGGGLGLAYSPKCVKISAGTKVNFNGDFSFHPLTQTCGPASTITDTSTGTTVQFTLSTTGDYGYECMNHFASGMVGAIRVQ